jgi:two-component system response regulator BaeR
VARVRAVLRRTELVMSSETAMRGFGLDERTLRVRAEDKEVELTRVEFYLLQTLFAQPGRIFSRSELMDRIYPDGRLVSDRTIDSHVKKLRKKLAPLVPGAEVVHSVYGAGYRFEMTPV